MSDEFLLIYLFVFISVESVVSLIVGKAVKHGGRKHGFLGCGYACTAFYHLGDRGRRIV